MTTAGDVDSKHLNDPLPTGELRPESFKSAVNQVIQQATAKQPTNRYGTVADFVQALQTAVRRPTTDHHPIVLPFDATLRNPYKARAARLQEGGRRRFLWSSIASSAPVSASVIFLQWPARAGTPGRSCLQPLFT
ncbi:MAG: hypothetical protein H6668_15655 [Ardenticatenaceae bacterium]|nr:hypothetical protein [Ardenticatenaceae bacterium]